MPNGDGGRYSTWQTGFGQGGGEYIQNLQVRTKWNQERRNLTVSDIMMMKDEQALRNSRPLGRVIQVIKSNDGKLQKVTILTNRNGQRKTDECPISVLVLLVPCGHHPVR